LGDNGLRNVASRSPEALHTYNVHIYRVMRLYCAGITASTHAAAAQLAANKPTSDAERIDDCDGETLAALVDEVRVWQRTV
jgi:hypothetical protein